MRTSVKVGGLLTALAWLVMASTSSAATSPVGTWVKKAEGGKPAMKMTIESWGVGDTRLSYSAGEHGVLTTVTSNLDGMDSPVLANGKSTPATMAFTLDDQKHATVVSKLNQQPIGISRWSFSSDFKTLTIDNDFTQSVAGMTAGKSVERWTRQ
jgi:hypothetical protein